MAAATITRFCLAPLGVGLSLLLLGAAAPAGAATVGQCRTMLDQVSAVTAAGVEAQGDTCVFQDVLLRLGPYQSWHAAQVALGWIDLAALQGGRLPPAVTLAATGIAFRPQTPHPLTRYITSITAKPFDIGLAMRVQDGTVRLDHFTMDGPAYGSLRVSGVVHGFDPARIARWRGQDRVGLESLDVSLDNHGLFESFAAPALASALLGDSPDPAAAAEQIKAQGSAAVQALLTRAGSAPDTIGAITRWIAAVPHPTGRFTLHAAFPQALTWPQMQSVTEATPDPAALHALATVTSSYDGP